MHQTMAEKIISARMGMKCEIGEVIPRLPVSKMFLNEVLAPPAIEYFRKDFGDLFKERGASESVFDPTRVFLIPDHTVPSCSIKVSQGVDLMKEFAKTTGVKMFKECDGIEHVLLPESGVIVPGDIMVGTDSHTDTNGALNCLAFGIGTTDAELAMATGFLYNFTVPQSIYFKLSGALRPGVSGKDVILSIIGKMGAGGCAKRVAEFGGEGISNLSMDDRFTIANMCVEMSARTGLFPCDEQTEAYIVDTKTSWDMVKTVLDEKAAYERVVEINLNDIEPMVSFPHLPAHAVPISRFDDMARKSQTSNDPTLAAVVDDKINFAFIGSCTNGRKSDLLAGAEILKGKQIHQDVTLIVIPGSRQIYNWAAQTGVLQIFAEAGANIQSSNCGTCFGKHMGVLSDKGRMISTSNRNYQGRMGSKDAQIFLASPATVATSALTGRITAPQKFTSTLALG
ncbi:MAG: aconitase/3-isopropylmalate dehydratase large subunit family protein [Alphaproteobacteria bacterium]|nr:aconitase/3-isopropylmalate dehydratase large subunit family protein [Alphaproteobacteria bacterium]